MTQHQNKSAKALILPALTLSVAVLITARRLLLGGGRRAKA